MVVELGISERISSGCTLITLGISRRTSGVAKEELGFWSFGDVVAPIRFTFDFGDSTQALVSDNFGPLSKELYDLGNIL